MRKISIFTGIILFFGVSLCLAQEQVTITTYYPSPYGVYNQMVTKTLGVGDTDGDSDIDANDAPDPATDPGDVWVAGFLGIGTANPQEGLHVAGGGEIRLESDSIGIHFIDTSPGDPDFKIKVWGSGDDILAFQADTGTGFDTKMVIHSNGNIGIGAISPGHPLEMASGAHVTAGGVWTDASSIEYKTDIASLTLSQAVEALTKLNPVIFSFKAARDERHVGFIAEEVPNLVATKDRDGLSPMDIVAVLTKVVQQQQKEIGKLKVEIRRMKGID